MTKDYDEKVYTKIPLEHLIVFSIFKVIKRKEVCTFERLVKECFTLFPKTFAFYRYPQWPDSLRLDRPLRKARERSWIKGSPRGSFTLTVFGKKLALKTQARLSGKRYSLVGLEKKRLPRGSDAKLLQSIKDSPFFHKFKKNKKIPHLTNMELRSLLHSTLETPKEVVRQNLQYCKNLAEEAGEKELSKFLIACESKLKG